MKRILFILFIAILPFMTGCQEINLTQDDSGKTITVKPNQIINITLVSNRSTGNLWRKIEYDNNILQQASDPVYEQAHNNLIGAPGKVTYKFIALKTGVSKILMEYGDIGNKKSALKKFELEVVVR